jgi:hypothetical protein
MGWWERMDGLVGEDGWAGGRGWMGWWERMNGLVGEDGWALVQHIQMYSCPPVNVIPPVHVIPVMVAVHVHRSSW